VPLGAHVDDGISKGGGGFDLLPEAAGADFLIFRTEFEDDGVTFVVDGEGEISGQDRRGPELAAELLFPEQGSLFGVEAGDGSVGIGLDEEFSVADGTGGVGKSFGGTPEDLGLGDVALSVDADGGEVGLVVGDVGDAVGIGG